MISLRKKYVKIVGSVPIWERLENGKGDVVGEAKMELTRSGSIVAHIDMRGLSVDILRRGFSLGEFPMTDPSKENDDSTIQLETRLDR